MKKKFCYLLLLGSLFFISCSGPAVYYQVCEVRPLSRISSNEKALVYEDDSCIVSYNLWDNGGNIGFRFYNKTNQNIYLNMTKSFFILNELTHNYYQNRVFMYSSASSANTSTTVSYLKTTDPTASVFQTDMEGISTTKGALNSMGSSVSYAEEKIICIPAKSAKIISEFKISQEPQRDCYLYRYPNKKQILTKEFLETESPLRFSNKITYSVGEESAGNKTIENEFYVYKITNFPKKELLDKESMQYCEEKKMKKESSFRNASPSSFYIEYTKTDKTFKH